MKDLALLIIRLTVGTLLAGHGAQKLFGWFGGRGLKATGTRYETLGLRPGQDWALTAGLLTALGLLYPLGPISLISAMSMASIKVHADKPIWANQGGAELPVTYMLVATALGIAGPGRFSVDGLFRIKTPRSWIALAATTATVLLTIGASNGFELEPKVEPVEAEKVAV